MPWPLHGTMPSKRSTLLPAGERNDEVGSCRSRCRLRRASLCTIARLSSWRGCEAKVSCASPEFRRNCGPAQLYCSDHLDIRLAPFAPDLMSYRDLRAYSATLRRAGSRRRQNSSGPRSDSTRPMGFTRRHRLSGAEANSTCGRYGAHRNTSRVIISVTTPPAHQGPPIEIASRTRHTLSVD
jgi:hypothetical protein